MARVSLNTIIVTHFCNSKQLPNFATLPVKSPMVLQLFPPQPHFKYGGKKQAQKGKLIAIYKDKSLHNITHHCGKHL